MSVGTLGTASTTALAAVTYNPSGAVTAGSGTNTLAPADLAAIANSIVGDGRFAVSNPTGILATGTTHSNATLDTLVAVAGGPLPSIQVGDLVLGVNAATGALVIPPGTFVIAKPTATSVTLSQAATNSASGMKIGIIPLSGAGARLSFNGQLEIPGRGLLKVNPGDVVAVDSTGWPILVSAASIAYAGSQWAKA